MKSIPTDKHPTIQIPADSFVDSRFARNVADIPAWSYELDANGKVVSTRHPPMPITDPYLDQSTCVARLIREWEKHGRLIVAVDFDSTLHPFPLDANHTHEHVIALVKECSDLGWHIVLFTASDPVRYPTMRTFLDEKGIKVVSINENPPELNLTYGRWGKVYYNVLLDDRAGLRDAYDQLRQVVAHAKAQNSA